jgi:xanthine dehydrogenase YagS FAD-binding subunit
VHPFSYARPATADAAVRALADGGPGTRLIAGGTTLYDLMKLDVETPDALIDVSRLRELSAFDTSGSHELVFGAMAHMSDVAADARLVRDYPAIAESLWRAASQQLRNMATLGGNLLQRTRCAYFRGGDSFPCNKRSPGSGCSAIGGLDRGHAVLGGSSACIAVYPGDFAVALAAFDAQVDTLSPRGERTIAIESLHREPGTTPHIETTIAPDEMILRIRVPVTPLGRGSTYLKIRDRESYAFALSSAAVALVLDDDTVRVARVALGGVATRPWRVREAERSLVGRPLTDATARAAGDMALAGARPGRDNGFKIELGARTVVEALMIAKGRASRDDGTGQLS